MLGHKEAKKEVEDEARNLQVGLWQLLQKLVRSGGTGEALSDAALIEVGRDERLRKLAQERLQQTRNHVHIVAYSDGLRRHKHRDEIVVDNRERETRWEKQYVIV
jgi:hypothetical protein